MEESTILSPSSTPTTFMPMSSSSPTSSPSINITETFLVAQQAEAEHEFDAQAGFVLIFTLIACLLLAYSVKRFRIYWLPESAGALLVGVVVGGIARLSLADHGGEGGGGGEDGRGDKGFHLELFEFSPEVFFFFLLPPIIFEAGYSLDRKGFFDNIGAITLYAFGGTIISTFVVGYICYGAAIIGLLPYGTIDTSSPMEALLFGSLISAVDPVATLSIMGNEELNVDPLLYSLVFGESVLNDAIAISLFKTFFQFYNVPNLIALEENDHDNDNNDTSTTTTTAVLPTSYMTIAISFVVVSGLSIFVGVLLGLGPSWLYKHTQLRRYPNLETSLLLCFCYLCYATAEALELSGIMALFFQGVVLSHYNAYNLSPRAHVASEQIFSTFATLTETIVFVYMGMGVFTGGFQHWNLTFCVVAFIACLIGRALNIFPLSFLANLCRKGRRQSGGGGGSGDYKITPKMQMVLWFAGLRGAIAFALAENMPGPHKDVYATATLTICIVTTVVCGGFTERILTVFGMREEPTPKLKATPYKYDLTNGDDGGDEDARNGYSDDGGDDDDDNTAMNSLSYKPPTPKREETILTQRRRRIEEGIKGVWNRFDSRVLQPHFGGEDDGRYSSHSNSSVSSGVDDVERRDDRIRQTNNHDNNQFEDDGIRLDTQFADPSLRTQFTTPPRSTNRNTSYVFEMQTMNSSRNGSNSNNDEGDKMDDGDDDDNEETVALTSKRAGNM
mmetsp:Transcript_18043/g.43691  ORF Transcript_18043/g.43691 Transcript_18043/m.43691 type:complete len:730 (-) Transcript_18043:80-2269(-)